MIYIFSKNVNAKILNLRFKPCGNLSTHKKIVVSQFEVNNTIKIYSNGL